MRLFKFRWVLDKLNVVTWCTEIGVAVPMTIRMQGLALRFKLSKTVTWVRIPVISSLLFSTLAMCIWAHPGWAYASREWQESRAQPETHVNKCRLISIHMILPGPRHDRFHKTFCKFEGETQQDLGLSKSEQNTPNSLEVHLSSLLHIVQVSSVVVSSLEGGSFLSPAVWWTARSAPRTWSGTSVLECWIGLIESTSRSSLNKG